MQLGLVGLGRMGGNMRERLRAAGHEVVGYDRNPDVTDVASLAEMVAQARRPPRVGVGDGAGRGHRGRPSTRSPGCSARATSSSTAATPGSSDDPPRAERLGQRGIGYIDVGVSGGVWGTRERVRR